MLSNKRYFFYIIYGIAVTIFFLFLLFPSDTVKAYIQSNLNRTRPDISIAIERIRPVFPPGVKLLSVSIYRLEQPFFDLDQITIRPKLLSLFSEKYRLHFKAKLFGGGIRGTAILMSTNPLDQVEIDSNFSNIQISQIPLLERNFERKISGRLGGNLVYKGKGSNGTANGSIKLTDSEIELPTPVLSFNSMSFEQIEADLVLQNRMLQVKQCILTGEQVKGNFSGIIRFNTPFNQSGINLSGTLKPQPSFVSALTQNIPSELLPPSVLREDGFTLYLRGTFADPGYTIR